MSEIKKIVLNGPKSSMTLTSEDPVAFKLAMLFEFVSSGCKADQIAPKYGYTREHLYAIRRNFEKSGSDALRDKPPGPLGKSVRTEPFNKEIIRYKMFDPDTSPKVIAQKMRQCGIKASNRSVERTCSELGLGKKNSLRKIPSSSGKK